ncbi:MAG: hypothetical protein ACXVY6_08620 [Gaiellaceae bacterium]
MSGGVDVVSPELVLVAPELAEITWRREAAAAWDRSLAAPAQTQVAVGRTPFPGDQAVRAAAYCALAGVGLALGLGVATISHHHSTAAVSQVSATVSSSAVPAASITSAKPARFVLPAGPPHDVSSLAVSANQYSVELRWRPAPYSRAVLVERSPGRSGRARSAVYEGMRRSFVDDTIRSGTTYRYVVYGITRGGRRSPGVPAVVRP